MSGFRHDTTGANSPADTPLSAPVTQGSAICRDAAMPPLQLGFLEDKMDCQVAQQSNKRVERYSLTGSLEKRRWG